MSFSKLSAVDIVKSLKEGQYTCEEIAKSFIEQINKNEKQVEAWEFFDQELVLNQAKKLDEAHQSGKVHGDLHGVPVGIKDIFDTEDMPTTDGTEIHKKNPSWNDCAVVSKLKLWECNFAALGHPGNDFWSREGVITLAKELDEIGAKFKNEGIKFGYHNHNCEFAKYTDKTFLEEIYNRTNPEHLYVELDVHWVTRGGGCPVKWIYNVAGRMPVIHFKDFVIVDNKPVFCEIGEGNLDWQGIIKACEETNVRWYSIEQDAPFGNRDIFESMEISYNNLKKMGVE